MVIKKTQPPKNQVFWLTFFGRPALIAPDGTTVRITLRYRKGYAMLAWLASQLDTPVRRGLLSAHFWPNLENSQARHNLRTILSNLSAALKAAGLEDALEVEHDWVMLRRGSLVTDEMLMTSTDKADGAYAMLFEDLSRLPWFDVDIAELNEEIAEWITARRTWFEAQRHARQANDLAHTAEIAGSSGSSTQPEAQWHWLAILCILLDDPAGSDERSYDERSHHADKLRTVKNLAREARIFGGRIARMNESGITLAFGVGAQGGGFRWRALRTALALAPSIPRHLAARWGMTAGSMPYEMTADGTCRIGGNRITLAERFALHAEPGELICDESLADIAGFVGFRPAETWRFRGFHRDYQLFRANVSSLRAAEPQGITVASTPLIGRTTELETLRRYWHRRESTPVTLCGPPGIGKTRLAAEFAQGLQYEGGIRVFWVACCAELASTPWAALHEALSRFMQLSQVGPHPHTALANEPTLKKFLDHRHVAYSERGEMARALARAVAGGLIVVDDAQWLDMASADLYQAAQAHARSTMFLLTRRPQPGGWEPDNAYIHNLSPLDDDSALAVIESLTEGKLPQSSRRAKMIAARGIPLFLVADCHAAEGGCREMLAGLCNLANEHLPALGTAAMLGQQFRRSDLSVLVGEDKAAAALESATPNWLVIAYDADNWGFVHPLLREEVLSRLDADSLCHLAGNVAGLFLSRGETARAAPLLETAGKPKEAALAWLDAAKAALAEEDAAAATAMFANVERLGYPAGADGLWARILHARARVINDGYGTAAIHDLCGDIPRILCAPANEAERELVFAADAMLYLWAGGTSREAGLDQARKLALAADTPERRYASEWAYGNTLFWLGRFNEARRHFEWLLASPLSLEQRTRYFPSDPFAFISTNHAWLLWFIGEDDWRSRIENHLTTVNASPYKQDTCIAHTFASTLYLCAGDSSRMAMHAQRAHDIATMEGFAFWELLSGLLLAIVSAKNGGALQPGMAEAAESALKMAYPAGINSARWLVLEALVAAGHWSAALQLSARAIDDAERCEHSYCLPDIWRLAAIAHEALGNGDAARQACTEARRLAGEMGAKGWLARWEKHLCTTPTLATTA